MNHSINHNLHPSLFVRQKGYVTASSPTLWPPLSALRSQPPVASEVNDLTRLVVAASLPARSAPATAL